MYKQKPSNTEDTAQILQMCGFNNASHVVSAASRQWIFVSVELANLLKKKLGEMTIYSWTGSNDNYIKTLPLSIQIPVLNYCAKTFPETHMEGIGMCASDVAWESIENSTIAGCKVQRFLDVVSHYPEPLKSMCVSGRISRLRNSTDKLTDREKKFLALLLSAETERRAS